MNRIDSNKNGMRVRPLHTGTRLTESAGMKLSTIDLPSFDKKVKAGPFYDALLDAGYTGIEMVLPKNIPIAKKAGLEIVNLLAPGMRLGLNRLEHHDALIPKITDLIYLAGENKIPHVIVFSGNRAGMADGVGHDNIKAGLDELIPEALDNKVMLIFEMLNTFDHPDYMADRATFGLDLVTKIASPALRLLYDIYHMHRMREDYMEDLTENIACVAHIHASESPDRTVPQAKGDIKYADMVPKAIKAGYKGYWGMEFEFGIDPIAELREAAKTFLALGK